MTTKTFNVDGLLSVLGAQGIERQLQKLPGVSQVSVNNVSGSTTVTYDAGKTSSAGLQAAIQDCGFHCAGEALPAHMCEKSARCVRAAWRWRCSPETTRARPSGLPKP